MSSKFNGPDGYYKSQAEFAADNPECFFEPKLSVRVRWKRGDFDGVRYVGEKQGTYFVVLISDDYNAAWKNRDEPNYVAHLYPDGRWVKVQQKSRCTNFRRADVIAAIRAAATDSGDVVLGEKQIPVASAETTGDTK